MISIIVPAYNISEYMERCVESLVNQTYRDIEIILVDDGSTDSTGKVCDELKESDDRIKVIHKTNGGLSDARNAGIDVAEGEYIAFVDGDDYVELDAYEKLISYMDEDVSFVVGGYVITDIHGGESRLVSPKILKMTKEEAFYNLFIGEGYISQSSWNKLFRREIFIENKFKYGIFNEDMEILPRLIDKSNKIVVIDSIVYHYIKKEGSITTSKFSKKRFEAHRVEKDIYAFCKKKYPSLEPYAAYYESKSLYGMLCNLVSSVNRKEFIWEELYLRFITVLSLGRCMNRKEIKEGYGTEIKNMMLLSALGETMIRQLSDVKRKFVKHG